jgi:Flp pilus assembly protein TadG
MHEVTARRRPARSRPRSERGVVAVEFALVLPLLVMLLLGVTTVGLTYSDHLSVTNAVRESARLGSSVDYATSTSCPACSPASWADAVQERVRQVYYNSGSTISTSQICVELRSSAGTLLASPSSQGSTCGTAPTAPADPTNSTCVVKVWTKKPARVVLGILPDLAFNVGAQSVSSYSRTAGTCTTP